MTMREKKNIVLLIIAILLFGGGFIYFYFNNESKSKKNDSTITNNNINSSEDVKIDSNGNKENVSKELKQSQTSLGVLVSSIDITSTAEYPREATIKLNVINVASTDIKNFKLKIDFIDKTGKTLTTVYFPIELLKADAGLEVSKTITHRVIDAHEYRFERVVG